MTFVVCEGGVGAAIEEVPDAGRAAMTGQPLMSPTAAASTMPRTFAPAVTSASRTSVIPNTAACRRALAPGTPPASSAKRGVEHGSGLGKQRWVVERGFSHLHHFRRLRIRYERDPVIHTAFLTLACSIMCWRRLQSL